MELIDRYVHAVRPWLPFGAPRDEILRELAEDIRSEADERRGERAELPESELEALLKARGHPMAVAARYVQGEALIGPAFYPLFRLVLKIVMGCLLPVLALIALAVTILSANHLEAGMRALLASVEMGFTALGVIVTVFVALEHSAKRPELMIAWHPRLLPRVRDPRTGLRWHAAGTLVGNVLLAAAYGAFALGLLRHIPHIDAASLAGALPGATWNGVFEATWRVVVAAALLNAAAAATILAQPALGRPATLVIAGANTILGAMLIATVLPYLGVLKGGTHALAFGARARVLAPGDGPLSVDQLAAIVGPAVDPVMAVVLLAWGLGCLIAAFMEAWRYSRL